MKYIRADGKICNSPHDTSPIGPPGEYVETVLGAPMSVRWVDNGAMAEIRRGDKVTLLTLAEVAEVAQDGTIVSDMLRNALAIRGAH